MGCFFVTDMNSQELKLDGRGHEVDIHGKESSLLSLASASDDKMQDTLIVKTGAVLAVGITSVTSGGSILTANLKEITSFGLCWNTKPNPSVHNDLMTMRNDASSFLSRIDDLVPATLYFIRAYAITAFDTVYGDQKIFYTHKKDAVTDIDSNYYNSVKIGTQIWLAEDLKTTRFNDGTPIRLVTDPELWARLTVSAWCWYANDSVKYSFPRGKLYNWYSVNSGILCPKGWHVPSNEEWITLQNYLGGDSIAGGKVKTTGTFFWKEPNQSATNETGFSAIPGGYRGGTGKFLNSSIFDSWWSSDEYSPDAAHSWYVYHARSFLYKERILKLFGNSVRCLKDQ